MTEAIHPSIVTAICKVQGLIGAVKKDQPNHHGGYQFASTDAIYAELTHKLANAGLMILCLEAQEPEIVRIEKEGKTSQWGKFHFVFVLATAEATWSDPRSRRSLYIQITGPQTFMAAQSYAEKTYLRSLFKLPTGDVDLDAVAQAETEEDQAALASNGKKPRKSSAVGKRDGSVKLFNTIRAQITAAQNPEMLAQIRTLYAEEWATLPVKWELLLSEEYEDRMVAVRPEAAE